MLSFSLFSQNLFAGNMAQCSDLLKKLSDLESRYASTFKKNDYEGVVKLKKERNALAKQRQECIKQREEERRKRECESLVKYRDGVLQDKINLAGDKNTKKKLKHYHQLAADLEKQLNLMLEETWYERNVNAASRVYVEVANRTLEIAALFSSDESPIGLINDVNSYVQYGISEARGMASNKDRAATALSTGTKIGQAYRPGSKITKTLGSKGFGAVVAVDGLRDSINNISDHSVQQDKLKSEVEKQVENIRKQIKFAEEKFKKEKGNYKEEQNLRKLSDDITKKCP